MTTDTAPQIPPYAATTGRNRPAVDRLWSEFRSAVGAAYKAYRDAGSKSDDDRGVLRDYVRNMSMRDAMDALEAEEVRGEKEHRAFGRRLVGDIGRQHMTHAHAARLILLGHVATGAKRATMPPSIDWLTGRRTCTEAQLLGFLIHGHVSPEWIAACDALDYADAVK